MEDLLKRLFKEFEENTGRAPVFVEMIAIQSIAQVAIKNGANLDELKVEFVGVFDDVPVSCGECINCLASDLEEAVEDEDYLLAAKLRDKIKELENV